MAGTCTRPVIWLSDEKSSGSDAISIRGETGSRVIFPGVLGTGRGVEVIGKDSIQEDNPLAHGDLCGVIFRHSILVPGWSLHCDSIADATTDVRLAISSSGSEVAYAELRIACSTIVGEVLTHALKVSLPTHTEAMSPAVVYKS